MTALRFLKDLTNPIWANTRLFEGLCSEGNTATCTLDPNATHESITDAARAQMLAWAAARFAGRPAVSSCNAPPVCPKTD